MSYKYFCMIKAELSFDVSLNIDHHNCLFISTLHNLTLHKKCGEIKGDITKEDKTSVYTISQSEIDENVRGIGLGYKFYIETIKKCFGLGCMEFRSSTSLNEMSIGGLSKADVQLMIQQNTYSGLQANMALMNWRKC